MEIKGKENRERERERKTHRKKEKAKERKIYLTSAMQLGVFRRDARRKRN